MPGRFLTRTIVMVAVVALAVAMAIPASAGKHTRGPVEIRVPHATGSTTGRIADLSSTPLWNQYDNPGDVSVASIIGDQFSADDFTVPPATTWAITEIDLEGGQVDPSTSFRVAFYEDAGGVPGELLVEMYLLATQSTGLLITQFSFDLSSPVILGPGTYWLSVADGFWGWLERTVTTGHRAAHYMSGVGWEPGWWRSYPDNVFRMGGTAIANVPPCTITGTDADDGIVGTSTADFICGGPGIDQILGRGGNDTVKGGLRKDFLDGSEGDDLLLGKNGPDVLSDQLGNDRMKGGAGADILDALDGSGGDILIGGPGIDHCGGDPGDTFIGCETIVT